MPKMPSCYNKWFTHYMRLMITCVPCQSRFTFCWTKVTRVTLTLGSSKKSRLPHCFLLVVSLIFPQCGFKISFCILPAACVLLLVCSLHFTPGPQCAFYTDRFNDHPDDDIPLTYDITPGFKPFTLLKTKKLNEFACFDSS